MLHLSSSSSPSPEYKQLKLIMQLSTNKNSNNANQITWTAHRKIKNFELPRELKHHLLHHIFFASHSVQCQSVVVDGDGLAGTIAANSQGILHTFMMYTRRSSVWGSQKGMSSYRIIMHCDMSIPFRTKGRKSIGIHDNRGG